MAAVWTEYQGVKVVTFDSKVMVRHPRWGYEEKTLATLHGATLLGLEDGTFLVVCNVCGFNGITGRNPYKKPEGEQRSIPKQADSVMSHINGMHHPNKINRRTALYTDAQIKSAIKVWLKWRNSGVKSWTRLACDELTIAGIKPLNGSAWNTSQLGGLVRQYLKKERFRNVKAAPMTEADQRVLAEMVRASAARAGTSRQTTLAAIARITSPKTTHEAAPLEQQEEETDMAAAYSGKSAASPTLNFAGSSNEPVKTLTVDSELRASVANKGTNQLASPLPSDYVHVAELPGDEPMFTYKGVLMVGKPVKSIQV